MSKTATVKARDPFALKFKGSNKAFAPFAAVGEGPAVAQLWLCAAPVASHLEAGERVANLAWRLWAIHERTVVDESARHRRSFKRLAKGVSERLDRDRARPVHELSLPELAPVLDNGDDATERLTRRVDFKANTRRRAQLARGTGAQSMMHTFALDPTVGLDPTASSSTSTAAASRRGSNVSSAAGVGRPALSSSEQGSGGSFGGRSSTGLGSFANDVEMARSGGLNLTYPTHAPVDGQQRAGAQGLQRAPSIPIPSSLRMTPNSSRRSSFARPAMQQQAQQQQQQVINDEANLPPPYPSNHPFARGHPGPAADVLGGSHLFQPAGLSTGQANMSLAGQQNFQSNLDPQQQQQAVADTLNHLWGQLGTGASNASLGDFSGLGGASSFETLDPQQQQVLVGTTPASSSDASSPDHNFSPAATAGASGFHFAQRVTGIQGQQQASSITPTNGGGSGTPLGPHRRSSNSDGMGLHGAPYRRPSLSQQSSALPSGAGSPAGVSRRASFAQRRRESTNAVPSGTITPADGSALNLGLSTASGAGWMTPTGDLAAGLFGVELASPLDEPAGPRLLRQSSTLAATSPQPLKHRTFSSGSGGGGLYGRSGLLSSLTPTNGSQMTSTPVFFDDVPMEDAAGRQHDRPNRRMSDSNVAGRAASSHSLRDQLREMQLQHQSYQQAAGYASTLESYVPPPAATSSTTAGFHTRSSPPSNGNEAVFPALGGGGHLPSAASLFDVNAHPAPNASLGPSPRGFTPAAGSLGDSALFSFAPQTSLDDIFNDILGGGGGGSTLNSVTEAEHDS